MSVDMPPVMPETSSSGVAELVDTAHFRYPGSPPFRDTELDRRLFRGRTQEADTVLHSILSSNLFLLYAESGLGKTSLLNAGVLHQLRLRDHWPVSVRLNDPSVAPVAEIRARIADAAAADPDVDLVTGRAGEPEDGSEASLWDVLAGLEVWRGNELQQPVLVFDQFEELFTLEWDPEVRQRFITEFGEVVRGHRSGALHIGEESPAPDVRFVLVIREDSLGELDALAVDVPQIMRNRFRLGPLDPKQARAAITEPAALEDERLDSQRFAYTDDAAEEILTFLRTSTDRGSTSLTAAVDPSQLQIVCQYVEQAILPEKSEDSADGRIVTIDAADLGGKEGLDRILSDFYRRTIESLPPSGRAAARELCEEGLINRGGRRLSLEQDEIGEEFDVGPATLQALVDGRLLRADPRVGSVYYELAHDTLVGPIRAYRIQQLELERQELAVEYAARRRTWRRRLASIVYLVVAVVVVAAFFLALREGDDESSPPPVTALDVGGDVVDGEIEEAGEVVSYSVEADPADPLIVVVTPAGGLNAVIEVTNGEQVKRLQDQLGGDGAERLLIPPVGAGVRRHDVTVTSFDSTLGTFTIGVEPIDAVDPTDGPRGLDAIITWINSPGDLAVFSVETVADVATSIEVVPRPAAREAKLLDIELEIVDARGAGRTINDLGPGEPEAAALGEPLGVQYVIVRGRDATTGAFNFALDSTPVVTGGEIGEDVPARAAIAQSGDRVNLTFEPTGDGLYSLMVEPEGSLDAVIEIDTAAGESVIVDAAGSGSPESWLLEGDAGPFQISVSGWETTIGGFEVGISGVQARSIEDGDIVEVAGGTVFEVDLAEGKSYRFSAKPRSQETLTALVLFPDVAQIWSAVVPGEVVSALIGGPAGSYRIHVTATPDEEAQFTATLSEVVTETLRPGDSITATGQLQVGLDVSPGEFYELLAEPRSDSSDLFIQVSDGSDVPQFSSAAVRGEPVRVLIEGGSGPHRATVSAFESVGEFEVSLRAVVPEPLLPGDSMAVSGDAQVFEVEIASGELYEVAVGTGDGRGNIVLEVLDDVDPSADRNTIFSDPAAALIGCSGEGQYRLIARSEPTVVFDAEGQPTDSETPDAAITLAREPLPLCDYGTSSPDSLFQSTLFSFLTPNGVNPRRANCSIETLAARHTDEELFELGVMTMQPEPIALIEEATRECGVTDEQRSATLESFRVFIRDLGGE